MRSTPKLNIFLIAVSLFSLLKVNLAKAAPQPDLGFQVFTQSWIAFVDNEKAVHVIHPDGSNDQILYPLNQTIQPGWISLHGWSATGRFLAFSDDSSIHIWDSQSQSNPTVLLSQSTIRVVDFRWNPKKEELFAIEQTLSTQQSTRTYQIEIWNVVTQTKQIVYQEAGYHFLWSPNGEKLFFDMPFKDTKDTGQEANCPTMPTWISFDGIYSYDLETDTSMLVISAKDNPLILEDILPNGNELIFYEGKLFCTGMDGPCMFGHSLKAVISNSEVWTSPPGSNCVWSLDGKKAICGGDMCEGDPLRIIDEAGKLIHSFSEIPATAQYSIFKKNWSPDNQKIALTEKGWMEAPAKTYIWDSITGDTIELPGNANFFSWSPDGRFYIVSTDPENNYQRTHAIFDYVTKSEVAILGPTDYISEIAWQPPGALEEEITSELLLEWLQRKNRVIDSLTNPEYGWLFHQKNYGNIPPLPPLNEDAAKEIIQQLTNQPASNTAESNEAFYRFLLQEETLEDVHKNYVQSSDDMGETWADLLNLSFSTYSILSGHQSAVSWFRSFLEDIGHVMINMNTDIEYREQIRTMMDLIFMFIFNNQDVTGYFKDLGIEAGMRWYVANQNQVVFNEAIEPLITKGANSVLAMGDPIWHYTGTRREADANTGYLARQSTVFTNFSHENYQNTRDALDVAKVIDDIADLALAVTKGSTPWYVAASKALSLSTILYLDWWKLNVNIQPALNCNMEMANAAGNQSFNPENPNILPVCESPEFPFARLYTLRPVSSTTIDGDAWAQFKNEYSAILDEYSSISESMGQDLIDGKKVSSKDDQEFNRLLTQLNSILSRGSAILTPKSGQVWDEQTLSIMLNMMEIKANTALFLLTLDIPNSTLENPDVLENAIQNQRALQDSIDRNLTVIEAFDFAGSPSGIPSLEISNEPIIATEGEPLEIQVRLNNIGSTRLEVGLLSAQLLSHDQPGIELKTPYLESGEEQVVLISFPSIRNVPNMALITFTVNESSVSQHVEVIQDENRWDINKKLPLILAGSFLILFGSFAILAGIFLLKRRIM